MVQKTKAIVKIAGREYTIRAFESEEYLHKVAIYVNRRIDDIERAQSNLSTQMVAVLTALNLGDEVLKLQTEIEDLKAQIKDLQEQAKRQPSPAVFDPNRRLKR